MSHRSGNYSEFHLKNSFFFFCLSLVIHAALSPFPRCHLSFLAAYNTGYNTEPLFPSSFPSESCLEDTYLHATCASSPNVGNLWLPVPSYLLHVLVFSFSDTFKDEPMGSTPCSCENRSIELKTNKHIDKLFQFVGTAALQMISKLSCIKRQPCYYARGFCVDQEFG